jgi:hypothetical protein
MGEFRGVASKSFHLPYQFFDRPIFDFLSAENLRLIGRKFVANIYKPIRFAIS